MGIENWLQSLVFAAEYSCSVFLRKNCTLVNFIAFWWQTGLLQVCDCKKGFLWRRLWAWILWGNPFGSVTGKIQTHEDVKSHQVKRLGIMKCFNIAAKWLLTESGY